MIVHLMEMAGGGYYGGGSSNISDKYSGGGGSSFISGYEKCNAILDIEGDIIEPSNQPIHYSQIVFYKPKMIDGNNLMPNPIENNKETGHTGNGYARITFLSSLHCHFVITFSLNLIPFISFSIFST